MAEFVQQNIEDMLPELEYMERVQLFTAKETKYICKYYEISRIVAHACSTAGTRED